MKKLWSVICLIVIISIPNKAYAIESNNSQYLSDVIIGIVGDTGSALGIDTSGLYDIISGAFDIDINKGVDEKLLQGMLDYAVDMSNILDEKVSDLMNKMVMSLANNHDVIIEESDSDLDILCKVLDKLSEEYTDVEDYSLEDLMQIALNEAKGVLDGGDNEISVGLNMSSIFSIMQNTFRPIFNVLGTGICNMFSLIGLS